MKDKSKPLQWVDTTSYSQSGSREPRSWTIETGGVFSLSVTVTRHIHYPGEWLVQCRQLGLQVALRSEELDDAKAEALDTVAYQLKRWSETVERMKLVRGTTAEAAAGGDGTE